MPLARVCLCASSCGACGFPWRVLQQVTLQGLRNLSGSSCLACSYGGVMFVGFAVSLVRSWVFPLVSALPPGPAVGTPIPAAAYPWGFLPFF